MVKRLCFFLIPLCLLAATNQQSGMIQEAVVTYEVKYPKLTPEMSKMANVLPMRMTVSFRYHLMCSEVSTPGTYSKTIIDARNRDMTILAHVNNRKIKVLRSGVDAAGHKTYLEKTDDTTTIAGFLCKKAILTNLYNDNTTDRTEIWYSDRLGSPDFSYELNMPELRGVMMRYTVKQNDMEMIYQAIHVEPKAVDRKIFAAPDSGYELMTDRQFMHLMMK